MLESKDLTDRQVIFYDTVPKSVLSNGGGELNRLSGCNALLMWEAEVRLCTEWPKIQFTGW
jgi:hypothetical protein